MAYELINTDHPDASTRFKSLDDVYFFSGQTSRLNKVVLDHEADGPPEIDLKMGDTLMVAGNHWDGYSKGTNSRTGKTGLYPSFKVAKNCVANILQKKILKTDTAFLFSGNYENSNCELREYYVKNTLVC